MCVTVCLQELKSGVVPQAAAPDSNSDSSTPGQSGSVPSANSDENKVSVCVCEMGTLNFYGLRL